MKDAWPSLSSTTLTDQVYSVLRDKVISGAWREGSFIREQEISDKLGVSRTPVREALARLASEGFLERIPHRGFRLPEQAATDLLELYPILASLEVLAAKQSFPRLDEAAIAELRAINRRYAAASERADSREGVDLNNRFHHMLSQGSQNRRLIEMLESLRAEVTRLEVWAFSRVSQWDVSIREHDEILDAVAVGDFDRALATLEQNRLMTFTDFCERIGDATVSGASDVAAREELFMTAQTPRQKEN